MTTEHVIRVKATQEVIYNGSSLDDCKQVMKPAFFDHIDKGLGLDDFPLEAVTIYTLEESEMDIEEEEYPQNDDYCTNCGRHYSACICHSRLDEDDDIPF